VPMNRRATNRIEMPSVDNEGERERERERERFTGDCGSLRNLYLGLVASRAINALSNYKTKI
jgi:hypothetical protein